MQTLESKKLTLLLISLVAIFILGVTTSPAQEKIKFKSKRVGTYKSETIQIDDIEGHTLSTNTGKGVDVITGSIFFSWSTSDLVKGNGTHQGYGKTIDKDGDVVFDKFQGTVSTTMSPKGIPLMAFEGTWFFTKGTGKWKNVEGSGTYKGKFVGPGIVINNLKGECFIK